MPMSSPSKLRPEIPTFTSPVDQAVVHPRFPRFLLGAVRQLGEQGLENTIASDRGVVGTLNGIRRWSESDDARLTHRPLGQAKSLSLRSRKHADLSLPYTQPGTRPKKVKNFRGLSFESSKPCFTVARWRGDFSPLIALKRCPCSLLIACQTGAYPRSISVRAGSSISSSGPRREEIVPTQRPSGF